MNLSINAIDNNREISIIVDNPDVIKKFKNQFIKDWENLNNK